MRAWTFQDSKQLAKHGAKKCPWSVGWYDARGRKKQKTIGQKTAAAHYARKLEGEAAAGLLRSHDRMKWAEFVARFTRDHLATLAPGSQAAYKGSLDCFTEIIAPAYLDQVDEATIAEFRGKRVKAVDSVATVNKDLRHLRCALRKAKKWKLLPERVEIDMLREPERDPYFVDDAAFRKLYDACDAMTRPAGQHYEPAEWWRALLTFAFMTGWRISEILSLRREHIDWAKGEAYIPADATKGKRDARVELHPVVLDHLKMISGFGPMAFDWPLHKRTLWSHFDDLKTAAKVEFPGAFHRFRFGFANVNVDALPADVLQRLMRHKAAATTRRYINAAERMKRQGTAERLHVPTVLQKQA
jgi:integrase